MIVESLQTAVPHMMVFEASAPLSVDVPAVPPDPLLPAFPAVPPVEPPVPLLPALPVPPLPPELLPPVAPEPPEPPLPVESSPPQPVAALPTASEVDKAKNHVIDLFIGGPRRFFVLSDEHRHG